MLQSLKKIAKQTLRVLPMIALPAMAIAGDKAPFSKVQYLNKAPVVDGIVDETWQSLSWHPLKYLMEGSEASAEDFSGDFKLAWRKEGLYVLARIKDDRLFDQYADPLVQYWDDDALEIFVDADQSGGEHKTSYNAFAYHIGLDNQNADIDDEGKARLYNDHVVSRWLRHDDYVIWEVLVKVFNDDYDHRKSRNKPLALKRGMQLGFMLAYCDNDDSLTREHFYGSTFIEGENKNLGWINASVFTPIELAK